jgi:hypothetical protein
MSIENANGIGVIEVTVRDVNQDEFIYWVKLDGKPECEDEYDWAINKAVNFHIQTVATKIAAPEDENDIPVLAYEPFTRYEGEFVWVG